MWLYIDNGYLFFFHSSHPSSYCGEDVLLPKALLSSLCLPVLSACTAVGVWYHEECRSKFGLKGLDARMYQWHDCRFVKSLPDSFNQLSRKLHKGDIWHDKASLSMNKSPIQQRTPTRSHAHSHTHTHTHTRTHTYIHTLSLFLFLSRTLTHTHTNIVNQLLITE